MAPLNPRSGRPYSRLTAHIHERDTHCHLCGLPVIKGLRGTTAPLAPTVDHLTPIAHGGDPLDPSNCRLACRVCNTSRGTNDAQVRARCLELSMRHRQPVAPRIRRW